MTTSTFKSLIGDTDIFTEELIDGLEVGYSAIGSVNLNKGEATSEDVTTAENDEERYFDDEKVLIV